MGKKLEKEIVVKIVDRFIHGYKTKEIERELAVAKRTIDNYTGYYRKRKAGEEIPASMCVSQECADAICEAYGFEKETIKYYEKYDRKEKSQKSQEPEQLPGQMKMELPGETLKAEEQKESEDRLLKELDRIADQLSQIQRAMWALVKGGGAK